jgi:predicted nucleic acid-binding protein
MPVNVQAEVIDISFDTPKTNDTFLVDSNVWYWLTYSKASLSARTYQLRDYPSYISKSLFAKSVLSYSGLSLAELAHLIEKAECSFFNSSLYLKQFRRDYPAKRANVFAEVQSVWSQIKAIAVPINLTIDESTTDTALTRFQNQLLDGYDLFILETMKKEGIENVITDDADYITVPKIRVFTSNRDAIRTARSQGKLLVRQ